MFTQWPWPHMENRDIRKKSGEKVFDEKVREK